MKAPETGDAAIEKAPNLTQVEPMPQAKALPACEVSPAH
jgi:hypothetical protein